MAPADSVPARRSSSRIASLQKAAPESSSATSNGGSGKKRVADGVTSGSISAAAQPAPVVDKKAKTAPSSAARPPAAAPTRKEGGSGKRAAGTLVIGDALPQLTLKDEAGNDIDVGKLAKCVIFTYPKANTGGCTKQACLYRDEYAQWETIGYQVYGLSNDGPTSLKNWKAGFPYALLSDPKRDLVGVLTGSKTSTMRSHFVVGQDGHVALSSVGVKPAESSPAALKFAQGLS